MRALVLVALGLLAAGAGRNGPPPASHPAAGPAPPAGEAVEVSPDLQVRELEPGLWLHVSWSTLADGARFPSNGLIVAEGGGLALVDTAWGEARTEELLGWIERTLKRPILRAVGTHAHDDRIGGGAALARRGIPLLAHPRTRALAPERGLPLPESLPGLGGPGTSVAVGSLEVFYPGPGHSEDNVVVWLPDRRVLFGGCALRAAATTSLGNVADADLAAWPESIRRALARYPEARLAVPGHGAPGGPELLRHTLDLLTAPVR